VVEVLHYRNDGGSRGWSVGSGFLIRGNLVLTAAHNVGIGELLVRIGGIERSAAIRLKANPDFVDLAVLEIQSTDINVPLCRYGAVDRASSALIERCWAVGFPQFKERPTATKPLRLSAQVNGEIPTGENLGHQLLSFRVTSTPGARPTDRLDESEWSGMSGAIVFAGDVLVGSISEHHRPEGESSLTVVPVTAVDTLDNPITWWDLFGVDRSDLVRLPESHWEARLRNRGLHLWTNADFKAGLSETHGPLDVDPIEPGEPVDVALLRQGRLLHLQEQFKDLASLFDNWIATQSQQKRGPERLRVLWLEGESGPHRSKGLLACLSRASTNGRVVYDAGRDFGLAAEALNNSVFSSGFPSPPLISVDLEAESSGADWATIRNIATKARTQCFSKNHPYTPAIDSYPRIIVGGTAKQAQTAHDTLQALVQITPVDTRGRLRERPYSFHGMSGMESATLSSEHIFNRGLPITTRMLFGREEELQTLMKAWTSEHTKILSVVAYGGTGKSALVNTWLREMRKNDYLGARRILAWSFYSQGTKENLVSADPFVSSALSWLGDKSSVTLNPWAKGLRLASLIKRHRFLLILDGMEPLQHPLSAPDVGGQLTDDSMRALLEELAKPDWKGLCVVTTRVPLTDLRPFDRADSNDTTRAMQLELENLDDEAGAALLKYLTNAKKARFQDLQLVLREVDGHALAITLLGNYLRDVHNGNLAGRFDLEKLTVDVREGGHARRIMASYVKWLEEDKRRAELAALSIIGLFDRPAAPGAMNALMADRSLKPLTAELDHVGGQVWNRCVGALRGMGLLNNEIPDWPGVLDAHPLVREHFREELQKKGGDMWRQGNRTLFEYYSKQAPLEPSNTEEMNQLYAAVTHGCGAGLHQEVFDSILLERVWRDRRTNFSTRRLGMTGSDLVALSNYFQHRRWTELRERPLSSRARVLIMTNAGVRLRQLGRLVDARRCFGAVVQEINPETSGAEELEDAAYAAAQNCELLVIAGKLNGSENQADTALANGRKAVKYAKLGNDVYFSMHARSSLAEVHFMLGDLSSANQLFEEAMEIDRNSNPRPRPPFLYSQSLFRYGYFLIETGQAEKVLRDAGDPAWGTNGDDSSLLSQAIRLLIIGAAHRSLVEAGDRQPAYLSLTEELLDDSVVAFRTAGYADYVVRGLLERAHFRSLRRHLDDYTKALEDLDKATFEAQRGQMELLFTDVLLQRATCYLQFWSMMTNAQRLEIRHKIEETLREASGRIVEIQYWRRKGMLADLQGLAGSYGVSNPDI
jgi:tetratricopeptide (TPR) repeat protein